MAGIKIFHDRDTAFICIAIRLIVCTLFAQAPKENNAFRLRLDEKQSGRQVCLPVGTITGALCYS